MDVIDENGYLLLFDRDSKLINKHCVLLHVLWRMKDPGVEEESWGISRIRSTYIRYEIVVIVRNYELRAAPTELTPDSY